MRRSTRPSIVEDAFELPSPLGKASFPDLVRGEKLIVQKAPQLPAPARMLQLPQRLGLDLADALAGDAELLADLFEGVVGVHADAEAHAQDAFFTRRERGQDARRRLAQVR